MSSYQQNSKQLAKNTLLLYFRMLVIMGVGLYTSRITLNVLGVSDYGINNVVGGVVTMASFLNAGLTAATQRFISYEIGRADKERLGKVFSSSLLIHSLIAVVILLIAETVGLWFVNNCLNIEASRMTAANWVYQCSILSFMVSILSVPYNSCIVAHERMSAFAYISILEAALKLVVAFSLTYILMDKLILYGLLTLAVSVIIRLCYGIYCKKHFEECSVRFSVDRQLLREMTAFSGWSMFGNLGFIGRDQGANVILNILTGTALNAARGIGLQVSSLVNQFSTNFSMAMNPQITKTYASGDMDKCSNLVYEGAKFSFFLLAVISIPVIINSDYILTLWLGNVPPYTSQFLMLSLVVAMLSCFSQTVTTAIQATKRLKVFQLGICILLFCELPFVWLILRNNLPPYLVMVPQIVSTVIALLFRFYLLKRYVPMFRWTRYVFDVLLRSTLVVAVCLAVSIFVKQQFSDSFFHLVVMTMFSMALTAVMIYLLGLNSTERALARKNINKAINKFKNNHLISAIMRKQQNFRGGGKMS